MNFMRSIKVQKTALLSQKAFYADKTTKYWTDREK